MQVLATDRIRVLYSSYHFLQRQRAQAAEAAAAQLAAASQASSGSGLGFGLLRSSPTPPPAAAVAQQQAALAAQQAPLPLADYVLYMQEFAHVRMQALLLLKQLLLSDEFAQAVGDCVVQVNEMMVQQAPASVVPAPGAAPSTPAPSSPSSVPSSVLSSWSHACFWQLCLDEVLFPLLGDLASPANQSHGLYLDSSLPMGVLRAQAVSLLCRVFLRTLPSLSKQQQQTQPQLHAAPHSPSAASAAAPAASHASFARTWLNVLKTLDRYMQLGVHLQCQQTAAMQAARAPAAAAAPAQAGGAGQPATPTGLSASGVPLALGPVPVSGMVFWSADSGVQLTESVAEALKNVVLVMKAHGVFDEAPFHAQPQTPGTSTNEAAAPAAAASGGLPTGELWQLTVGMLTPWLPFIPALQAEILPPPPAIAAAVDAPPPAAPVEESQPQQPQHSQQQQSHTQMSDGIVQNASNGAASSAATPPPPDNAASPPVPQLPTGEAAAI